MICHLLNLQNPRTANDLHHLSDRHEINAWMEPRVLLNRTFRAIFRRGLMQIGAYFPGFGDLPFPAGNTDRPSIAYK